MRTALTFGVAAGLIAMAGLALPGDKPPPNQVGDFMRIKLEHSKKVLEGLALEDYPMISKHANKMSLLSHEASWNVLQTEEYLLHSGEFQRTAATLTEAAQKKNLDGAALAYVELTMKCINCHKYVREVRMARFEPQQPLRRLK